MLGICAYIHALLAPRIQNFGNRDKGATAVEYGIMVAAIAALIIAIVFTLGGQLNTMFEGVSNTIKNKGA